MRPGPAERFEGFEEGQEEIAGHLVERRPPAPHSFAGSALPNTCCATFTSIARPPLRRPGGLAGLPQVVRTSFTKGCEMTSAATWQVAQHRRSSRFASARRRPRRRLMRRGAAPTARARSRSSDRHPASSGSERLAARCRKASWRGRCGGKRVISGPAAPSTANSTNSGPATGAGRENRSKAGAKH